MSEITPKNESIEIQDREKFPKYEKDVNVENIVATVSLKIDEKIDLTTIARRYVESEYNPERFPGLVFRFQKPKATTLIFSTGKIVITGLIVENDAQVITKKLLKVFKKVNIKVTEPEITIQNIVATSDLGKNVDLNMAAIVLERALYEPEVFPGLVLRMTNPKTVFLIFSTGKTVCTGLKDRKYLSMVYGKLTEMMDETGVFKEEGDEEFLSDEFY